MSPLRKILIFICALAMLFSSTAIAATMPDDTRFYSVACIGDSLTYGTGSNEPDTQSWPSVLTQEEGNLILRTYNYGVYGSMVRSDLPWSYRSTECYEQSLTCGAAVYLIMLGSNDCRCPDTAICFEDEYRSLLETYISLPNNPTVIVLLPPDMYYDGFSSILNEEIYHVRDVEQDLATEYGLDVIDLSVISSQMEEYCIDGGHYSSDGYAIFADYIYDALCDIL